MQDKLCIIISSEYPKDKILWNEEVQRDLVTVKETLANYHCIEITIPVVAGRLSARKLVQTTLDAIPLPYTTCHIVLNTHGIPGLSDLKNEIVKQVVENLSEKHIAITQLSALLCDGMSPQEKTNAVIESRSHTIPRKEASMRVLQKKLNAMTTEEAQNFQIRGFTYAYLPDDNQDEVIDILMGRGGIALNVSTQPYQALSPVQYATQILESIAVIMHYKGTDNPQASPEYIHASNLLGLVLSDMKRNVLEHLKNSTPLAPEFSPLLETIKAYCINNPRNGSQCSSPFGEKDFDYMYNSWIKNYKLYSDERIKMLENYATILRTNYESNQFIKKTFRGISPHIAQAFFAPAISSEPEVATKKLTHDATPKK